LHLDRPRGCSIYVFFSFLRRISLVSETVSSSVSFSLSLGSTWLHKMGHLGESKKAGKIVCFAHIDFAFTVVPYILFFLALAFCPRGRGFARSLLLYSRFPSGGLVWQECLSVRLYCIRLSCILWLLFVFETDASLMLAGWTWLIFGQVGDVIYPH